MSSAVIRFEVQLPYTSSGSNDFNAIETFKAAIAALATCYYYPVYAAPDGAVQFIAFFGYITASQSAAALAALTTLNSALSTGAVPCTIWSGTSEP